MARRALVGMNSLYCFLFLLRNKSVSDLDNKTEQIGLLIAKLEENELLQEHRAALINQAVTKGLDPDIEMKNSELNG